VLVALYLLTPVLAECRMQYGGAFRGGWDGWYWRRVEGVGGWRGIGDEEQESDGL